MNKEIAELIKIVIESPTMSDEDKKQFMEKLSNWEAKTLVFLNLKNITDQDRIKFLENVEKAFATHPFANIAYIRSDIVKAMQSDTLKKHYIEKKEKGTDDKEYSYLYEQDKVDILTTFKTDEEKVKFLEGGGIIRYVLPRNIVNLINSMSCSLEEKIEYVAKLDLGQLAIEEYVFTLPEDKQEFARDILYGKSNRKLVPEVSNDTTGLYFVDPDLKFEDFEQNFHR